MSSNAYVKPEPESAHGTISVVTPHLGQAALQIAYSSSISSPQASRCRQVRSRWSYRAARPPQVEQNELRFIGFTSTTSDVSVNLNPRMRVCFKPSTARSRVVMRMDGGTWWV